MSSPPDTVLEVSPEEEAAIRAAVRAAGPPNDAPGSRIARVSDAQGLLDLFMDPRVSDPIYDLPRPFTLASVTAWIEEALEAQARGECVLSVSLDPEGRVAGYTRITIWPDRSAGEIAGGRRADLQNSGQTTRNRGRPFDWVFETLGVRLMCLTAALDNVRSARLIDAAGFRRMGERTSVRPDGSTRQSIYWELTREEFRAYWAARPE